MRYLGKHFEVAVSLRAVETIPEGQKKKQKKKTIEVDANSATSKIILKR